MPRTAPKGRKSPANDKQGWWMLIFESISAGGVAILVGIGTVLVLVGMYSYIVWPLTKWDFAGVNAEQLRPWWQWAAGLTFATGTLAGFWCFSGAAFRQKKTTQRPAQGSRSAATVRSPAQRERLRKRKQPERGLFNP
jgi:hypothetical protein